MFLEKRLAGFGQNRQDDEQASGCESGDERVLGEAKDLAMPVSIL